MITAAPLMAQTPIVHSQPVDPERLERVERAREAWLRRLVDRSRNNNLLYFRNLKAGTLDLSTAQPAFLQQFLGGSAVRLDQLLPDVPNNRSSAQARQIAQRARINQEEKGIATLYLALGLASWSINEGGRPPAAPVLLLPVTLQLTSRATLIVTIERNGDAQINQVLLDELDQSYGCSIALEELLPDDIENARDVLTLFARLNATASKVAGFTIERRIVLGNFSFLKLAIVQDMRSCADLILNHDMIAAMAGAPDAREAIRVGREPIDTVKLDSTPPDLEYLVLDADSSQQRVIAAVLRGQHGVIQGPPGTGKSQTIVNLITSLAAEGKRVLFVAEKRAALEVVLRRLHQVGLGHLALDLHGADVTRSVVMRQFAENLDLVRSAPAIDATAVHETFCDRRWRLNQYVAKLHTPRTPSRLSAYGIQGRLLRLPSAAQTHVRWTGEALRRLDEPTIARAADTLLELNGFADLFRNTSSSPWVHLSIESAQAAQAATELIARLAHELLPALQVTLADVARTTALPLLKEMALVPAQIELLRESTEILSLYTDELFQTDLVTFAAQLAGAKAGPVYAGMQYLFSSVYRDAETRANQLRRKPVSGLWRGPTLAAEIERAAQLMQRWATMLPAPAAPRAYPNLNLLLEQLQAFQVALSDLSVRLGVANLLQLPFEQLADFLTRLHADRHTAYRKARMHELLSELEHRGLDGLLRELQTSTTPPELWPQQLEHAWLSSCLDHLLAEDTVLAGFSGQTHTQFVEEFRTLDRRRLDLATARVRRVHAERVIAAMNEHPAQEDLVRREAAKRKRHLPLRTLIARAPDVLTALCPCWMASPLSVSQLIDARQASFDVVIFDEASQVLPEDAVAALLRGRQIVVAGDRHQLPPSRFFISGDDEEETDEDAPTEGFESLLDLLSSQLNSWSLDWHYRSRDEALIAFSNHHVYGGRLITFPGANATDAISHDLVPWSSDLDSQEDSASAEVARVVARILQHAVERPSESLGVITMGIKHAQRIEAALDQALREHPELEPFFSSMQLEPFFIKNLERVQGDERDSIILSVGYGKDRGGRLAYRFGPLLTAGGERRLNVAITRARQRLMLVSSFSHMDMEPSRSQARGVELLRSYLEYAGSHGRRLNSDGHVPIPLNPFEADVYDALRAEGIPLIPQWGVSNYRLDFAAQHPEQPGQFVLAIECDGATYHSAPTARDRDRLRQQHLEALGWRFHRIWSQDWFHRRAEQIERTVQAYRQAVQDANNAAALDRPAPERVRLDRSQDQRDTTISSVLPRGPRPLVVRYQPITEYALSDLVALVHWVQSDGRLRTDDEIIDEIVRDLGFQRRGVRIITELRTAITAAKHRSSPG